MVSSLMQTRRAVLGSGTTSNLRHTIALHGAPVLKSPLLYGGIVGAGRPCDSSHTVVSVATLNEIEKKGED